MLNARRRGVCLLWTVALVVLVVMPLVICWLVPPDLRGVMEGEAVSTGLVGFTLLVVGVVLMARIPSLLSSFGIERVLRAHRWVAVVAVALVLAHVVVVLVSDPRGLAILDLVHTTPAARAAITATVALLGIVALAVRRRRRQPRYEGWRLLHIVLSGAVLGGAWLHIWWLRHLGADLLFRGWLLLMGLVVVAVAGRRWLLGPVRARRRPYRVEEVVAVTDDAVTVAVTADQHDGIPFRPGQFAYLKVGRSPFVFEEHPFSMSSAATSPHRKEFTIKALGDFTELLSGLRPGRAVYLDGAYGAMTTDGLESSRGFVFIAGGIGITPMLSMLRTLAARGDRRRHQLYVAARSVGDLIQRSAVVELSQRLDLTVVDVLADPPADWTGERGRIGYELLDRRLPRRSRRYLDYFLCGPPPMVLSVEEHLLGLAVSPRRIHTERFEVV